jgi:dGTPase
VSPTERYVFHNRLTHSLEVAQIARRIAGKLLNDQGGVALKVGGLDEDVVEAAALAHDLGHPPFGHIAERALDDLAIRAGLDGFEGNAQTFRIITKLAVRLRAFEGLNLSRATLNAVLKYPNLRPDGEGGGKFGAYKSEQDDFVWARELHQPADATRSAEAEIMDWADDVAFAVADMEDFFAAGLIPLDRLAIAKTAVDQFLNEVFDRYEQENKTPPYPEEKLRETFRNLVSAALPFTEPYTGSVGHRASLQSLSADLIGTYVDAFRLKDNWRPGERRVVIDDDARKEVVMLKELTWQYVIKNPALAIIQHGQRQIVEELFRVFLIAAKTPASRSIFPPVNREQLERAVKSVPEEDQPTATARVVIDLIAGLTEQQALALYQRLSGMFPGSILDTIIR